MTGTSHKSAIFLASMALVALLLAGCGGGSPDSGEPASTTRDASPATSAPEAVENTSEREPAAAATKPKLAKTTEKAQKSRSARAGKHASEKPAAAGDEEKASDGVEEQLQELIKGSGGARVVSSKAEIRKAVRELQEGTRHGQGATSAADLEEALEDLVGGK